MSRQTDDIGKKRHFWNTFYLFIYFIQSCFEYPRDIRNYVVINDLFAIVDF